MKYFITLLIFLLLSACSEKSVSEFDKQIYLENGIKENTIETVSKYVNSTAQLTSYDEEFNEVSIKGVLIKVGKNEGSEAVKRIRKNLSGEYDNAYFYDNNYGYEDDEVAIVPTRNDIEYLKLVRTDGINHNLTAGIVLEKYKEWNSKYRLELFGAGRDWIQAEVKEEDIDWKSFAEEVAQFCPDVVFQGTGTIDALEVEMKKSKTLYLWWD